MKYLLSFWFFSITLSSFSQAGLKLIYKESATTRLEIEIIQPPEAKNQAAMPAIVFFYGGGWNGGTTNQFRPQAKYLASRGMVTILADYRVAGRDHTTPFESLMDAKSALRFVRKNAAKWNIDPNRIAAAGGSAGGHLAAATASIPGYNDPADDLTISCKPNALILFNPVIDNGPGGYGFERIGEAYLEFSPLHHLQEGTPPTLFFLGTQDALIPVATANYYKTIIERTGGRCDLHLYEGATHGFFNPSQPAFYSETLKQTDLFLQSIGYLGRDGIRPVVDTVGFAQYSWQMDSIVNRLSERVDSLPTQTWKAVISPHDDYKYAGEVILQALSGVRAQTVILFGVAHKAKVFGLEDRLVFGSHSHWQAPYGNITVSPIKEEILNRLDPQLWTVHDSMQAVEHSLEALTPFLQYQNRFVEIVPVIVPYMDFKRMDRIAKNLSKVLADILKEKGLELGKDVALVISNDAVHYGDEDWGGKNMAPLGSGPEGNQRALALEQEIIDNCLRGPITEKKMKRFNEYTVQKQDFREYKWTWCGRYALPLGLLTANRLNQLLSKAPLEGSLLDYATTIDHSHFPVEDLGMGTTAPANPQHWVGFVGMGYK